MSAAGISLPSMRLKLLRKSAATASAWSASIRMILSFSIVFSIFLHANVQKKVQSGKDFELFFIVLP
jgi:hypothetical protein